jgi:hypothetical protein
MARSFELGKQELMRATIYMAAIIASVAVNPARADMDVADFRGQCEASGDWCAGYVQAIMDMTRAKLCPPWGNYPHPSAPLAAVQAWLEKNKSAKGGATRVVEIALRRRVSLHPQVMLVPVEGIEPPTFGLQNHCSTAELNRLSVSGPQQPVPIRSPDELVAIHPPLVSARGAHRQALSWFDTKTGPVKA